MFLPECRLLHEAHSEDAHAVGRGQLLRRPTSSVAARATALMRLSHAAPGYLNPGTHEGLAPNTPEDVIACTQETA
jgi:hypothetical protein